MNRQQRRSLQRGGGKGGGKFPVLPAPVLPATLPAEERLWQADNACAQGWQAQRHGRLAEAETHYRQALAQAPEHAGALHLLGVLAHQLGHPAAAAELIGRSLAADATYPEAWSNLGTVLHDLHRPEDAAHAFRRALALRPDYPQAYFNLGSVCRILGDPVTAAHAFQTTLRLMPAHANALGNLGGLYHLYPDVAAETGDVTRAETVLRWALCLEPDHPDALSNLAARREAEGALSLAVTLYRRALALAPEHGEAHYNLANSLRDLGDTPGAEAAFRQALALMPHHAGAQWNLGLLRLENHGPGRERWRRYGWRLPQSTQAPGTGLQASPPPPLPLWSADSPAGSRPLLWREQGVGDEILFSALYGAVLARTAATPFPAAVIACDPRLVTLFARSFPAAQVVAAPPDGTPFPSSDSALTVADHQIAAGSLAATLCPTLGTLVATLPAAARTATWTTAWTAAGSAPPAITGSETRSAGWLVPDPSRQARWAARLTALGPEPKIGIAWRSGLANGRRAGSYRPLRDWGAVLTVPGVTFVTLQYGATAATLRDAEQRFGVHIHRWPDLDLRDDFEESAALTAALDLVITAPTAAGELAGALGVPTWRITPCGDWSVLGTAVRPYHPAMRLFQPRPGEGLEQALSRAGMALRRLLLPAIPYSGSP